MNDKVKEDKSKTIDGLLIKWIEWGESGSVRYTNGTKARVVEAIKTGIFESEIHTAERIAVSVPTIKSWINDYDNGNFDDIADKTIAVTRKFINDDVLEFIKAEFEGARENLQEAKDVFKKIEQNLNEKIALAKAANKLGVKIQL